MKTRKDVCSNTQELGESMNGVIAVSSRKYKWNLEAEMSKVIEKGVELWLLKSSRTEVGRKGVGKDDVGGGTTSWNISQEVVKVIEIGIALGFDFNGQEKEVSDEILRHKLEDGASLQAKLAYAMVMTKKCDVYSFGVVELEILMGSHPGQLLSSLDQNIMLIDISDRRLSPPEDQTVVQDIVVASSLAFARLSSKPKSRPMMKHVSQEFLLCKKRVSKPFHEISIAKLKNQEMCFVDEIDD
ncbi:hypothetical protein LWI28_025070 [Acer negundo]|uniref:non-specific serine/threonine protein kinase n=1 Tax=Acer negundo TaxID=4023 RepID=A0AAD5JH41_ACENE|nr:hypothetical protein LWI28_025070 [Acer negundo]